MELLKPMQYRPIRYWKIERLMFGTWLETDWYEHGATAADALSAAAEIADRKHWEGVRIGRELINGEHLRYCLFAWITLD